MGKKGIDKTKEEKIKETNHKMEIYYSRKEKHLCTKCGVPLAEGYTYTKCQSCIEKARKWYNKENKATYEKETRQWRAEHHCCTRCGNKDSRTMSGKKRCFECVDSAQEKNKIRYDENYQTRYADKHNSHNKVRYYQRKENGLCVKCGKPRTSRSTTYCDACLYKHRRESYKRRNAPEQGFFQERYELGLCIRCGAEIDPSLKSENGKSKLCQRCYDVSCKNLEKAHEYNRQHPEKNKWLRDVRVDWIRRHGTKGNSNKE